MSWRYQPVYVTRDGEPEFTLCEVYLDEDDNLERWTANPSMRPSGLSPENLQGDLVHMLSAAWHWKPVEFDTMKVGMTFDMRE